MSSHYGEKSASRVVQVQQSHPRDLVSAAALYPTVISNQFSEKTEKYISLRNEMVHFRWFI
jgi:hypothetical protein